MVDPPSDSSPTAGLTPELYETRRERLAGMAAETGADAVVVYGDSFGSGAVRYLTGFATRREAYLTIADPSPHTLYVQFFNHVPDARRVARAPAVEWGGPSSPSTVAEHLNTLSDPPRTVAFVGAIPHHAFDELRDGLGDGTQLVDLNEEFWRHRLVKDLVEIELTRKGATLNDAALAHLVESVSPGVTERELGAAVASFCTVQGGHIGICFLMATSMKGEGRYVPAQQLSGRALSPGDMVVVELSAGYAGHTGQILRTITLGPPEEPVTELHDVADEAFATIRDLVRPGVRSSALLEAAALIDRAGFTVCDDVVHGYGGGYLDPVLRTPATQHAPFADIELMPGMMMVVQPNVVAADHSIGVQTGELLLVTDNGHESLHRYPRGIVSA